MKKYKEMLDEMLGEMLDRLTKALQLKFPNKF